MSSQNNVKVPINHIILKIFYKNQDTDYVARDVSKNKLEYHLNVPDRTIFDGAISGKFLQHHTCLIDYDNHTFETRVTLVGEAQNHIEGALKSAVNKIQSNHLLVVIKETWFWVLQLNKHMYCYNCHPSQARLGYNYDSSYPAAIFRLNAKD